ncbi:major facilitator superfamily domain-containing protein [Xylogone sp. PMI_703]|nr:major facilitator superfamily domain-containing protein [Xylogone sp. PMI_703]
MNYDVEATEPPLTQPISQSSTISRKRAYFFMSFIVLTQLVQMMAYGAGIVGAFTIGHAIGATEIESTWIAAAYPLTQGAFVLISGRLGSVFGHKNILSIGAAWWVFWTLATAYGQNIVGVSFMRALAGIGGGLLVPNAIALLTITFPPGKQRNLSLALFTAMGPVGGAGGCVIVGIFMQLAPWQWLFFFLALIGVIVYGIAIISVEDDRPLDSNGKIDWVGSYLGVAGLILFNFVWNQAPAVGWKTSYEYALLVISLAHFIGFICWEAKWAINPVLPIEVWKAPSFAALILVLFLVFMSLGTYIWYVTVILAKIRGWDPVLLGVSWIPMAICGIFAAFFAAWAVPRMPAQIIIATGCVGTAAMNILIATTPPHQTYWAMIFPAMILAAFTGDMVFAAGQIITSSIVSRRHQGAAGSLIGALFTYGLSTGLGFAGVVEVRTNHDGADLLKGYRNAAYLAVGFAGMALIINLVFIRMKKNTIEGWQGEDATTTIAT